MPERGGRRNGSIAIGILGGIALLMTGVIAWGWPNLTSLVRDVDVGSCFLFAAILFWWAWSPPTIKRRAEIPDRQPNLFGTFYRDRNWGIGFETVSMVVGVLVAVVAILTLMYEVNKTSSEAARQSVSTSTSPSAPK